MKLDLNAFDADKFEEDDDYQEQVRATGLGIVLEGFYTSMTLQDVAEFIGVTQPQLLEGYFQWVSVNYPELDLDVEDAVRLVRKAVQEGDINIVFPESSPIPNGAAASAPDKLKS